MLVPRHLEKGEALRQLSLSLFYKQNWTSGISLLGNFRKKKYFSIALSPTVMCKNDKRICNRKNGQYLTKEEDLKCGSILSLLCSHRKRKPTMFKFLEWEFCFTWAFISDNLYAYLNLLLMTLYSLVNQPLVLMLPLFYCDMLTFTLRVVCGRCSSLYVLSCSRSFGLPWLCASALPFRQHSTHSQLLAAQGS